MDAIVTARVPIAIKERGNAVLKDLGATPSQLINAAYEFVLAEKQLPKPHNQFNSVHGNDRTLTPQQREKIRSSLKAMYIGPVHGDMSFREQLNEARDERYASLA